VEQSASVLPECERRFRSTFAHAAIGVAIIDSEGAIVYANQSLCRMSGYEEQELCQMHFTATLHPEDRDFRQEIFERILAGKIGSFINERRMLRKDGKMAWARTSVTVPRESPRPRQIIVFVEDITERKQAEDALRHPKSASESPLKTPAT